MNNDELQVLGAEKKQRKSNKIKVAIIALVALNAQMTRIGNCLQGQAIVMEVQTGEILAMVGLERNFEGKFQPCKNFAYQQNLGSLTKTASLLALFEMGVDDCTKDAATPIT